MNNDELSRIEWEAWQQLCAELEKAGVVTEQDLNSPVDSMGTQGQRILTLARHWGEKLVALMRSANEE